MTEKMALTAELLREKAKVREREREAARKRRERVRAWEGGDMGARKAAELRTALGEAVKMLRERGGVSEKVLRRWERLGREGE